MENKQSFGAYILRRRKELGMTQKEFAEKLYVTESAVSKWERGMKYVQPYHPPGFGDDTAECFSFQAGR